MTEKANLWYEIDKDALDKSVRTFNDRYLEQARNGTAGDPYSFAFVEHMNLLTNLEKSSYIRDQEHTELSALIDFLVEGDYRVKSAIEGHLSANLASYSYGLKASEEIQSILSSAAPALSGPEKVVVVELLDRLSNQCAVMVQMHSHINSVVMALEAISLATVSEFPRSPITKNGITEHFKPLWEAQSLYMLQPDQSRLSTFKERLEELLNSYRLVKLFKRESGGVSLMPAYFEAINRKIDALDVAVLLQEVNS